MGRIARLPLLVALLLLLGWATDAEAHHILGLPHYAYKDNYPQVPVLEYPAMTGPWDVLLTSYPGHPVPGEAANLSFYIKDRDSGALYPDTVAVRVLRNAAFGQTVEILPEQEITAFDKLYKITVTMPEDGDYIVELIMMSEGQQERIPFLVVAGQPSSPWGFVIAFLCGLALFVVVIRAVRIKRDRAAAGAASPPAEAEEAA